MGPSSLLITLCCDFTIVTNKCGDSLKTLTFFKVLIIALYIFEGW